MGPRGGDRYTSFHGVIFNPNTAGAARTADHHVICKLPPTPPARFVVNAGSGGQPEAHGDSVVTSWQECQLAFEFLNGSFRILSSFTLRIQS